MPRMTTMTATTITSATSATTPISRRRKGHRRRYPGLRVFHPWAKGA